MLCFLVVMTATIVSLFLCLPHHAQVSREISLKTGTEVQVAAGDAYRTLVADMQVEKDRARLQLQDRQQQLREAARQLQQEAQQLADIIQVRQC